MSRYYPSGYYTYPQAYYDPYTGRCFYDLVDEFDAVAYDYGDSAASFDHYADGGPLSPPTVCRLGCRDLSHRIPAGGLPEGAALGRCHQFAEEEGICLTHVEGGCFDHGICERLNHRIIIETCNELGYSGSDFDSGRQVIRVAAGLPPGRADDIGGELPRREMPAAHGGSGSRARQQIDQRPSGRHHQGGHEGSRRGPREPQYDAEEEEPHQATRSRPGYDGYGAMPQVFPMIDAPKVRVGMGQVFPRAVGTVKERKDDVLRSKGLQLWDDDILPKDTMGLIEDRLPVAAEAELKAA
ncbi:MAG: hypothetical protein Q9176_005474 [Flavoplaca citrina]